MDGVSVGVGREGAIHQVRLHSVEEEGLQGVFHVAGAGRGCDKGMGWVCGLEGTGEELCGDEGEVVIDWEGFGLCVKMPNGCHLHTACGYSEGLVLDDLELGDI